VPHLLHIPAAEDKIKEITLQTLIKEVQTLKATCDALQNVVEELKCRCDTYETLSERNRQEILKIHGNRGTIDTNYNGEDFELA
jgi:hypothetical protein